VSETAATTLPLPLEEAAPSGAGEGGAGASNARPLPLTGLDDVDFGPDGVIPVVAQDLHTREVLIPAFASKEMVRRTLETGKAWFWSRSRQRPWLKGEESGNFLLVREVRRNCYGNALLYLCEPVGPACHTGEIGCFYQRLDGTPVGQVPSYGEDGTPGGNASALATSSGAAPHGAEPAPGTLDWDWEIIRGRLRERPEGSYVVKLLDQGVDRVGKKIGEEAAEVIIAAKNRSRDELANEMADLWFHSLLLLADAGMTPADVYRVLEQRHRPR
jgi:phosphoribosyl-AMP cyclohydrolase / phosphoribosyl-ATP pyrophosphohydrolase